MYPFVSDAFGVEPSAAARKLGPSSPHDLLVDENLGLTATCRASFGMYNTEEEVDLLVDALELAHDLFA